MPPAHAALKQDARAAAVPDLIRSNARRPRPPSLSEPKIRDLIATLPRDSRQRLAAVADLYGLLRKHVAAALEPAINALLQEASATPTLDYPQKRALALEVNQVLALARLSILDPQTNVPAKLAAILPQSLPSGVLRLADSRKAADGRLHAPAIHALNIDAYPLQLVEHDPAPPGRPSALDAARRSNG
jgi:hypothetical protein